MNLKSSKLNLFLGKRLTKINAYTSMQHSRSGCVKTLKIFRLRRNSVMCDSEETFLKLCCSHNHQ